MKPTKVSKGGEVKIVDQKNFPATNIAAAIVTLKPGGLRELHWHPNEDEWQYYVKGKGRHDGVLGRRRMRGRWTSKRAMWDTSTSRRRTISRTPGDTDLVFLEVFPTPHYEDISLAEWLAHTPSRLVDQHIATGEEFLRKIRKKEAVITPE